MGVRAKLFLVSITLVAVVVLGTGTYLERGLRELFTGQLEQELLRHARMTQESLDTLAQKGNPNDLTRLTTSLGATTGVRITTIAPDGTVLADSQRPPDENSLAGRTNLARRPEVAAAMRHGQGLAKRTSEITHKDTLYAAVAGSDGKPLVRAAMPLSMVEEALDRLRFLMSLAAGGGLLLAVLISALTAHFATRALQTLVDQARAVAQGESKHVRVSSRDELGTLGQSLNRLAKELRATVVELVNERDRLGTILEGMHEGVLALNDRLEVESANPAAITLLSLSKPHAGQRLVEATRIPTLLDLAERALRDESRAEFSVGSGPNRREVLGHGKPLKSSGGAVVVLHDVTEARRIESIRRDLVANVSHELRTPVSIIRANSETLLAGALTHTERARKFVDAIERNSVRLSSLITDLLDLSRIEADRYHLEPEPLYPQEVMEELRISFDDKAKGRSITVHNHFTPELQLFEDRQAFEQVLLNLIDNAVKYSFEGGTVVVQGVEEGEQVRVEVRDDGPGIDSHHRNRIFERFYRIDPGRSRDLGGTGLGLSIVKHLVALCGGQVGVEPNQPRGTCFWFTTKRDVPEDEERSLPPAAPSVL